jgi:MFS transporter, YNFM family, putative membrane transport protein
LTAVVLEAEAATPIAAGTPAFRRTNLAMFLAGFATFALLYCVQPLMPIFAVEFDVSPAMSSLTVSLTTAALAVMVVIAGSLSESVGRKRVMTLSLAASALLTLAAAGTTSFIQLLALRLMLGIALSGIPAVALAYLGEEVAERSLGLAIGLYIAGSAFGGMIGRFLCGALADLGGWRLGLGFVGVLSALAAALFRQALPESRRFQPRPFRLGAIANSLRGCFADRGLPWLYASGFLIMGSFVTVYNYIGFRLRGPPYAWSQTQVGALFSVYLIGMLASAWTGSLADRYGRRKMLWASIAILLGGIELTRSPSAIVIVLGVAVVTIGFFGAHSLCSAWVTRRAQRAKAEAAALYLFCYYMGSSIVGSFSGMTYQRDGWAGVADLHTILQGGALLIALRLSFLPPIRSSAAAAG